MPAIEVDFDVFKALTIRRPSEDVTENDVLRQLLGLPPSRRQPKTPVTSEPGSWTRKGVRLPPQTELRATYKAQTYLARVENGAISLAGQRYLSPSAAASSITGSRVNGWRFWQYRLPGESNWRRLENLRQPTP
jgi:hypothetical protein